MTKVNINAIAATITEYAKADKAERAAKNRLDTAATARDRMVIQFADTCRGFGWTTLAPVKKGGEYRAELETMVAAMILSKTDLAAFQSDAALYKTVDGKRVYHPKQNAGNIVRNFLTRLITSAEPHVTGEAATKADAAGDNKKGKKAAKKDLDVFLQESLAAMLKRVAGDAKATAPTGKNHGELRKAIAEATKIILALTK